MQRYCAHYGCTRLLERPRRRQRLARPLRACASWPTRSAPACSAPCGGTAPRRPPTSRRLLGTNSGATSYHLRKLESVGLVQDTEEGEGKRRLWRASSEYHSWHPSDFEGDEDSETALNWLTRDYARHFSEQYDRWLDVSTTWPTAWQDACGSSDASVLVTAESLEAMREEMWELIERYRRVGQGNPQARRIAVYAFAYPLDLDRPPADRVTRVVPMSAPSTYAVLSPDAARRVFLVLTFTRWFPVGLVVGLLTLWQLERGLTVAQAMTVTSAAGLTIFALELPTSGFADVFGRRPVFVVSAVVNVVASATLLVAHSFWAFLLAAVLTGIFRALDSGPLEAWFVDTVHASTPGADVDGALSAQGTVVGVGIAAGALVSGGLVWWHPFAGASALVLPVAVFVTLNVLHLLAVLVLLREPRSAEHLDTSAARRALASAKAVAERRP